MKRVLNFYLFKPGKIPLLFKDILNGNLAMDDLEDYQTIEASKDLESIYGYKFDIGEKPVKFQLKIELKRIN